MSSSSRVNYSLRPSKTIERGIVFDGLQMIYGRAIEPNNPIYVGLGSVWFVDFHIAHKQLGIDDMISIESDPITFARATYNRPYRSVEVISGESASVIPALLERHDIADRAWILWLDYDQALDEDRLQELEVLVRDLPDDSTLLVTFSASQGKYGKPGQRVERLVSLLENAVPEGVTTDDVREADGLSAVLAQSLTDHLVSLSIRLGREAAVPSFAVRYQDGTPMVTIGVTLPGASAARAVKLIVEDPAWEGFAPDVVGAPPLTTREVAALRSILPSPAPLTRGDVQTLGFDLDDAQLAVFEQHYKRYPHFAQLTL